MSTISEYNANQSAFSQLQRNKVLSIRGRLLLGFVGITLIFLVAIGITLMMVSSMKQFTNRVVTLELPTYDAILELNNAILSTQMSLQSWLLTGEDRYKTMYKKSWSDADNRIILLDSFNKNDQALDPVFMQSWQETKSNISNLKDAQFKIENLSDKTVAINTLKNEVEPIFNRVEGNLNSINDDNNSNIAHYKLNKLHHDTTQITSDLSTLMIIEYTLSVFGILASMFIALLTSRMIIKHINLFRQHSGRIASGDLTHFISVESSDELGQLGNDLNTMTGSLAAITKEITQACHGMVTTLEEVRHAVDSQSAGASEQASSINEITASVSEIEKSTTQTMEKAKTLGEVAERTRERGQLGLNAVEQSVQGMKVVRDKVEIIAQTILDLSNQTQQVGEITSVVNNLAQQSKMLALNASIEAAKAGESGKGFAVVAAEVKNLAEQSEHSTEQVQKILEDIKHATEKAVMATEEGTKGVDHGTGLVEQTGEIIRGLNDVIHETTIASQQIEAAVRQESAGIEQITAGMNEINQVTSSFVESVKQTTEAMTNLSKVAKDLKKHVDVYKM